MITQKEIVFTSNHNHGRIFIADVSYVKNSIQKPIIIFCHGFKGFKDWGSFDLMAKYFANQGFVFLKFNFSMNGTTPEKPLEFSDLEAFGHNNFSIELDDLGVVIDAVSNGQIGIELEEINAKEIYLIGHSRGGGIVILKANEDNRIKKITTWASVSEYGKFWKQDQMEKIKEKGVIYVANERTKQQMPIYWQLYENYFENLDRLFIPEATKKLTIPFLIAHGDADTAVPLSCALELKEWNPKAELFVMKGSNHVFGANHPWEATILPQDLKLLIDKTTSFFHEN